MFDPHQLTNDELAAAANEYFTRNMQSLRGAGVKGTITIMLYAAHYGYATKPEFTISHDLHVGDIKLQSGNLGELVRKHIAIAGIEVTPPVEVKPMLAGPPAVVEPSTVYADFTEIHDEAAPAPGTAPSTLDDDVPF